MTALSIPDFQDMVLRAEQELAKIDNSVVGEELDKMCPLKHSFGEGLYVREIFMPQGSLIISKIHRFTHPYFVLEGVASVWTDEGVQLITAPYSGMTSPGTKRVLYIHKDTVWITVHRTDKTVIEEIEEEIIAKNFDEFKILMDKEEL